MMIFYKSDFQCLLGTPTFKPRDSQMSRDIETCYNENNHI